MSPFWNPKEDKIHKLVPMWNRSSLQNMVRGNQDVNRYGFSQKNLISNLQYHESKNHGCNNSWFRHRTRNKDGILLMTLFHHKVFTIFKHLLMDIGLLYIISTKNPLKKFIQVPNSLQQLLLSFLTKARIIIKSLDGKVIQFNLELLILTQLTVRTYETRNLKQLPLHPKE